MKQNILVLFKKDLDKTFTTENSTAFDSSTKYSSSSYSSCLKKLKESFNIKETLDGSVEYIFIFGGDGSYIKYIKEVYLKAKETGMNFSNLKFILVNFGTFGYHSIIDCNELDKLDRIIEWVLSKNKDNSLFVEEYGIFSIKDDNSDNNTITNTSLYLNDIFINEFYFNGYDLYKVAVKYQNQYVKDILLSGINISTSFGSSALNYAINKLVILNDCNSLIFSPLELLHTNKGKRIPSLLMNVSSDNYNTNSNYFNVTLSLNSTERKKITFYLDGKIKEVEFNSKSFSTSTNSLTLSFRKEASFKVLSFSLDSNEKLDKISKLNKLN